MPIHKGHDSKGYFYQYGQTGKKYYYSNPNQQAQAWLKARKQTIAINLSKLK